MLPAHVMAAALVIALAVDRWCGEPPTRWHPVVWIGRYLGWAGWRVAPAMEARTVSAGNYQVFWLGALMWMAGAATVLVASWLLQWFCLELLAWGGAASAFAALLLGCLLKPLLAWRMLYREVLAVEDALAQSLAAGRERLAFLVSRDVKALTESEVRESAIESLAENLNDSVVAPIFWILLLGLPGAALYRCANTADAMWGYRGVWHGRNWEWAGKWAARADDVLSWLPARITALLLALVTGGFNLRALRQEAHRTASPNSGWPMAAMALGLGVCLHKPGIYALNAQGRCPQAADTHKAIKYASNTVLALVFIALLGIFMIAIGSCLWS